MKKTHNYDSTLMNHLKIDPNKLFSDQNMFIEYIQEYFKTLCTLIIV